MSVHVTINDTELQRKIAKFAILSQKGLDEATRAVASRFTKAAALNIKRQATQSHAKPVDTPMLLLLLSCFSHVRLSVTP